MPCKDNQQSARERKHTKKNQDFNEKGKYSSKHIRLRLKQLDENKNETKNNNKN